MPLHKSWQWVGAFGPELMLCVARAQVGPIGRTWWAVWDGELREGTRGVRVLPGRANVRGEMDLTLAHGTPIEVTTGPAWTRKTPLRVTGTVGGRAIDLPGLLDESAGRHPRRTAWRWSAGVGVAESGEPVAWNLVDGLHDAPRASERTVWVAGQPREVGPVAFDGLAGVGGLRFTAAATRARRENLLVFRSDYEQPFGSFAGELPGAVRLRAGWGVMERHDVRW